MASAVDLMISFDTTSSMHAVLEAARRSLGPVVLRSLFADNPNLRVGLILHGDYGDLYETRIAQPTDSVAALVAFLADAPGTCGLDYPECYELVLHQAATKVHWRDARQGGSARILVVLGDAVPHEPTSKRNKYGLDWRKEARTLAEIGVAVYCVDCGGVGTGFYGFARELCEICGGATVPYRGCGELRRLLKRLLRQRWELSKQALNRQYRSYHSDSQMAQTAPTRLPPNASSMAEATATRVTTTAATATPLRSSQMVTALVRGGGCALGKTAQCAKRLLMYIGLAYLLCTLLCSAAC